MEFKNTKHQVARGARPDSENATTMFLFKKVSALRLTYQIRVLAFFAYREAKRLQIVVPRACVLSPRLREFQRANRRVLIIEKV